MSAGADGPGTPTSAGRLLSRAIGWPARRWRRSLLVRVVSATVALAVTALALSGAVLYRQVGQGLVEAQRRQALAVVDAGLADAQKIVRQQQGSTAPPEVTLSKIYTYLAGPASRTPVFQVLLLPALGSQGFQYLPGQLSGAAIPGDIREAVTQRQELAYRYARLPEQLGSGPVLVVGAPLAIGAGVPYELYYVFPLRSQQSTLALLRTRLLIGGSVLLILLVGVAVVVSRQVVTPVRDAAEVAGRLAAGDLTERMQVRGADDLARLATAFNEMAAGLQSHIGRLEDLSRAQRRFTADVSHELRTPLTTVRMAADVLHQSRAAYPVEVARAAELLQGELDRFEGLLADLLEISRYDANVAVLEVESVDMVELVRGVAAGASTLATDRGVTLDLAGVPDEPVLAEVDPRRASRLLRNLVANAIEYGEGRPVQISLAATADTVAVRVRDHGVGLRPEDVPRVFDRFWRADPSRTRRTGGTGLGLSIAVEDARLHGGSLDAWGEPGRGAAFRMVLPRRAGSALGAVPLPLADRPATPAPPRPDGAVAAVTAPASSA